MSAQSFRQLTVWNRAMVLATQVYAATGKGEIRRDWALRDQMRRAAISIPSNIAEGNERETDADACRFFAFAKGSAGELSTQLEIGLTVGALDEAAARPLIASCEEVARMLRSLIDVRLGRKPSRASRLVPRA